MATVFNPERKAFSDLAHMAARRLIYPHVFGDALQYEDTTQDDPRSRILDGEMSVDRIVKISVDALRMPLSASVQERFRLPKYAPYQDITMTEWNGATGLPSELYKIQAFYFVYGYFDPQRATFLDAVVIDTPALQRALCGGALRYTKRNNEKQQTFFTFKFRDLQDVGALLWRLKPVR